MQIDMLFGGKTGNIFDTRMKKSHDTISLERNTLVKHRAHERVCVKAKTTTKICRGKKFGTRK